MIKRKFDLQQPYRVVIYTRMSSDRQNPRSPEQQKDTILALIKTLKLPWTVVEVYTDAAISGRLFRKRNDLQRLLKNIRTEAITIDLILLDTFERFGRADEAGAIRKDLETNHGVLILTANSNFGDPTTMAGELLSAFEQARAKDDNAVKAHNVLRGKRDAVKLKHWPGGAPPFGYRLESVMKIENGRQVLDYSILVPNEATRWIIRDLYQRAYETGEGRGRLTQWFDANPAIPDAFKPISEATIGMWIGKEIYKGLMIWGRKSTDVVQDRRVSEHNPEELYTVVPEFCEPIVEPEIWDAVNAVVTSRKKRRKSALALAATDGKLIAPLAGGIAIKNILSGLVVCGRCGLAMVPAASGPYTMKTTGEEKRYATYKCPRAGGDACDNTVRIPIDWLNEAVVGLLRKRLFSANP